MKRLAIDWAARNKRLKEQIIFLFLDYDGTLAPIADTPARAVLSAQRRGVLRKLANSGGIEVAVISGRSLEDIKKMVGIGGIIYVGNHGLEIEGPKIKFTSPLSARYRAILEEIKKELALKLLNVRGALIEDKGLSLSIHYRLVNAQDVPKLKTAVRQAAILYSVRNKIKIRSGKMVLEVRPPSEWDKGKVALWLMARSRFASGNKNVLPIYIGDDLSDEDAFQALKNKGLTVFVGRPSGKFRAECYLEDSREVWEFLAKILETRQ